MSNLKVLERVIDCSVFQQSNYLIPELHADSIDTCCKQLKYAILTNSKIFIYGDYDVDGLMSMFVWKSVFTSIGYNNFRLYEYTSRTHAIQNDIVQQAEDYGADYIIICDTGSSICDRVILRNLQAKGRETIVIDHHACEYGYKNMKEETCVFNSYEERAVLNNDRVSGAYACLLVANVLCNKYLQVLLSSDARYFALASMYSDIIDMSSNTAIALYNNVILQKSNPPKLFYALNQSNYKIGRRFFQYMVAPALNNCFRSGAFDLLNQLTTTDDNYTIIQTIRKISEMHEKTRNLVRAIHDGISKKKCGAITLCFYDNNTMGIAGDLSGYTGLLANMVASEVGGAVVCLTKVVGGYKGSLRDQQGRNFLSAFSSFAEVGGHPSAFGIRISENKFNIFLKSVEILGKTFSQNSMPRFTVISSEYIQDIDDLKVLALYNEFMNTKNMIYIRLHCSNVILHHKTNWYKYYNVGLPLHVKTVMPLITGSNIFLEPCICQGIELREVVI